MREEPTRFEEICAQLEEWDNLPTLTPRPSEAEEPMDDEDRQQPLDELILAGLVAPY